jgi:hypothetical protein
MMAERLIFIRHSSQLRTVTEQEVLATLVTPDQTLPREMLEVDTTGFADEVAAGDWERSTAYLRERAAAIHRLANDDPRATELRYFGLAEIPHVIALGAFVGDERRVTVFDYDRERDKWAWRADERTLTVKTNELPREQVLQSGIAVIRIALSAPISDADVTTAVGATRLADVTISPEGRNPVTGLVQSAADVEHVRQVFRGALSAIFAARPQVDAIHLFVAAPVSICFVLGQELHLRSSVPVHTYRFRRAEGETSYSEAIRLSSSAVESRPAPLSAADLATAADVRGIWKDALQDVQTFASVAKENNTGGEKAAWWDPIKLTELPVAAPFPPLPPIWHLVDSRDGVAEEPFDGEYGRDKDARLWRLGDGLLVGLHRAASGDASVLKRLIHLFLFHEYLHDHNVLTKYTAAEVGAFPNCLEHIDYAADLYALLHQLAWARNNERQLVATGEACQAYLADLIDLAIRSFWAFEPTPPVDEWQTRRLRRYLNWYWRHVQVKRAKTLDIAIHTIGRQPAIELAGIAMRVSGRRVLANLTKTIPGEHVSLGIVLENEQLARITSSPVFNFDELLRAFREGNHAEIKGFFNAVYEDANSRGGAVPPLQHLARTSPS